MVASYYDTSYPPSLWAGPPPAPVLASIAPTTGVAGATNVTITATGLNFTATSVVRWNATPLVTTFVSPTQLTAVVPTLPAAGTYQVSVTDSTGTSANRTFTVTAAVEEEPASAEEPT